MRKQYLIRLLGPLAVRPAFKNFGIGKRLVAIALDAARQNDWDLVILIGDAPYYARFGFVEAPRGWTCPLKTWPPICRR